MEIFKNAEGQYSSKRAMGIMYLVILLLLYCYKELNASIIANPEIFIGMVCTGGGLIGIGLFEYFSKLRTGKPGAAPSEPQKP